MGGEGEGGWEMVLPYFRGKNGKSGEKKGKKAPEKAETVQEISKKDLETVQK